MSTMSETPESDRPRPGCSPQRPAEPGRWGLVLVAGLLLGTLRFYRLGDWSLWLDEAYTLADAFHGSGLNNPLGYWAVRTLVQAGGLPATEFDLRLLPAICGWLAIPLTWWAFRPIAGDRRAALAALLVAVSAWQLYWSQNARFYTMLELPALIGTGLVLRGLKRGSIVSALSGAAVAGAGVLLHLEAALMTAALVFAPWLVSCVCRRRIGSIDQDFGRVASRLALSGIAAALACSPFVLGVFSDYWEVKGTATLSAAAGSVAHLVQSTGFFLTPVLVTAAALGSLSIWLDGDRWGLIVLALTFTGLAAGAGAAALVQGSAQYVFVFMPLIALLAAWPLGGPWLRSAPLAASGYVALLALPLLAGCVLYLTVRQGERPRWREAYGYVRAERAEGEKVLGMQASVGEYYLNPGATRLRRPTQVIWSDRTNADKWKLLQRNRAAFWIVVRPDFWQLWPALERLEFQSFLRDECRLRRRFSVHLEGRDLDLEVYYRPKQPPKQP